MSNSVNHYDYMNSDRSLDRSLDLTDRRFQHNFSQVAASSPYQFRGNNHTIIGHSRAALNQLSPLGTDHTANYEALNASTLNYHVSPTLIYDNSFKRTLGCHDLSERIHNATLDSVHGPAMGRQEARTDRYARQLTLNMSRL